MSFIKPTIYLIKEDVKSGSEIFKVKNLSSDIKDNFTVFYRKSKRNIPDWAYFLNETFDVSTQNFKNSSSYAVLTITVSGRIFAIPLGMGVHLLDMTKIEYNFGLRAAINSIPKNEIRQIDTTKPELNSQKTKKLASLGTTPEGFEINKEKDILRGIVGKISSNLELGDSLDGKDSLRLFKNVESLLELEKILKKIHTQYLSKHYQKDYPWLDNISLIRDRALKEKLDKLLVQELKKGSLEELHFIPPVFFGEDVVNKDFVFSTGDRSRLSLKEKYGMPSMIDWKKDIGKEERKKISLENLDNYKVHTLGENGKENSWLLHRCLAWETAIQEEKFILSEGSWYEISPSFYKEVSDYFASCVADNNFPTPSKTKIKESDYNKEICDASKNERHLFDLGHELAKKRGLGKDNNEVCDVYDSKNRTFIHVKMGKSSSTLSHLLAQGSYSGVILKQEEKILSQFNKHLGDLGLDPLQLPYTPNSYTIMYVSVIGATQKKEIPFFSKVTFYNMVRKSLNFAGYKCIFSFVLLPSNV
ncbi:MULTISPECIES: DUF6119 family protein [Sphingobacterium]|uniref:DUF6119 family protein n=1 Tax=Sphingobacterium populi TaxID=1812824 RepID=A0ABW5UH37_9SPHI|nr:DUF6119 family protein [Sphingobacterium sp. CFCC 11742]